MALVPVTRGRIFLRDSATHEGRPAHALIVEAFTVRLAAAVLLTTEEVSSLFPSQMPPLGFVGPGLAPSDKSLTGALRERYPCRMLWAEYGGQI